MKKWSIALSLFLVPVSMVSMVAHADLASYSPDHVFRVGDTVVVQVSQGRTTGTIQRIDSDGFVLVATPQGFQNYEGPIDRLLYPLNQLDGFSVGQTVVVIVAQGRTTGTIQRIDSDGFVVVATPSGFENYQGPISHLLRTEPDAPIPGIPSYVDIKVGEKVVVIVSQGRTTGTVQRIDSDGTVLVATPSGFENYQGPLQNVRTILTELEGFHPNDTVAVTVSQGRTTGTIQRIDSDRVVLVATPSGFENYVGDISGLRRILQSLNGFSVGQTVVVQVSQGRTKGTIQRIESDGFVIVTTPPGFENYAGPIDRLIHTSG